MMEAAIGRCRSRQTPPSTGGGAKARRYARAATHAETATATTKRVHDLGGFTSRGTWNRAFARWILPPLASATGLIPPMPIEAIQIGGLGDPESGSICNHPGSGNFDPEDSSHSTALKIPSADSLGNARCRRECPK